MILNNVNTITDNRPVNVSIKIDNATADVLQLKFDNALAFPGLVNSHDHLDFNLFTQLGTRFYNNYTEWGKHIHANYKEEIAAVIKVPLDLRVKWGIFKNLLCGVTTVVNHGEPLPVVNAPINVEQGYSIHSVQFEKQWKLKLNNPLKLKMPVVIHVGEGNDEQSKREIDTLISWNLFKKKLIGVHGVAMTTEQAKKFEAVIWCPESNYFLLNKTAAVNHLRNHTAIFFGTDSTLTGSWNIWDHIRRARETNMLTDAELYRSLHPDGSFNKQTDDDYKESIVVVKKNEAVLAFDSFYATQPDDILLVVHDGEVRLFDNTLLHQLEHLDLKKFSKVFIGRSCKYVQGDLPGLMQQIKAYFPGAIFPVTAI